MNAADDAAAARARAMLAEAPSAAQVRAFPVRGMISARRAQAIFLDAMRVVMEEWFGRGVVEGRLRERERVAAILGHEAALRRRDLALELALTTDKTLDKVTAALEAAPRSHEHDDGHAELVDRMRAALQPLRQATEAFPFAIASDDASFTCILTKAQILAANEAILAADRALDAGDGLPL